MSTLTNVNYEIAGPVVVAAPIAKSMGDDVAGENHEIFTPMQQAGMRRDDLQAGMTVSAVLFGVFAIGLIAMILTVIACW